MAKTKNKQQTTKNREVKQKTSNTSEPQTMEELLSQTSYSLKTFKRGDKITGTIISVSPSELLVDYGGKSYAQVGHKELENIRDLIKTLKVGEKITGTVVYPENELGYMVISLRDLGSDKKWDFLNEKFQNNEEIEVKGLDVVRGGLLIDYTGIRGFIPASQLDSAFVVDPQKLKGKRISVKILELNKKNTRLVVSQKAITQKDLVAKQKEALESFVVGKKYPARVTGIASFGIFVVVPTTFEGIEIEGLIHISEIAWEKVEDPQKYVKVGDKIEAIVIGIAKSTGRLNLSIKQLTPDPWKNIEKRYQKEKQVSGVVSRISPFGAFVTLEKGVEGLIHISKIPPGEESKEGEKLECIIEMVDVDKRKISLSLIPKGKPVGYR